MCKHFQIDILRRDADGWPRQRQCDVISTVINSPRTDRVTSIRGPPTEASCRDLYHPSSQAPAKGSGRHRQYRMESSVAQCPFRPRIGVCCAGRAADISGMPCYRRCVPRPDVMRMVCWVTSAATLTDLVVNMVELTPVYAAAFDCFTCCTCDRQQSTIIICARILNTSPCVVH